MFTTNGSCLRPNRFVRQRPAGWQLVCKWHCWPCCLWCLATAASTSESQHVMVTTSVIVTRYCCRACSVMASVQDAQVHAMQALSTLSTIMARSSPAMHPPALPTSDASHTLTCLEIALSPLLVAATGMDNEPTLWAATGLDSRAAHYAIAQSTAQVLLAVCRF